MLMAASERSLTRPIRSAYRRDDACAVEFELAQFVAPSATVKASLSSGEREVGDPTGGRHHLDVVVLLQRLEAVP